MSAKDKILSFPQLLEFRQNARTNGQTIVHCHGCFDIVHPGHIQHLEFARSLGDRLVVSISADTHVNKGVNRPLIPDDLRAASVAALQCVDAVYINSHPTAVELLNSFQPDIYVKGREYEKNHDPRFLAERDAVTTHGGRVVFSSGEIVYSSTAIINSMNRRAFDHDRVTRFTEQYGLTMPHLHQLLQRARGKRVLVIGDYLLDRYHFCAAGGVAGEAPMMSLRSLQQQDFDGGAAVVALHLAGLGAKPILLTSLADDAASAQTELRLRSDGVEVEAIHQRRQLVTKNRFLVEQQKLFKVDDGAESPLDSRAEQTLADKILQVAEGASAVIFTDFGYGTLTAGLLDRILVPLRSTVPILTADISGPRSNLLQFKGVDLLCPTEREVRQTLNDFTSGLGAVVWNLLHETGAQQALITLGKQGLLTFDCPPDEAAAGERLRSEYLPAFVGHAIDPLGCGDALLATASLCLAAGGSLYAAALMGSLAAAFEAEQVGNLPITADHLLAQLHQTPSLSAAA
ncbi:MAG: adenylyltransferase/cytidyltransferase family protein [Phycisphaerales bacterium]|jgi:rfaE bifunctional protein kinase chain/domain/rfaE bifunctional protein nucleotidyltransferase chain/domain|nr:adenylyltransferase/cytidyltransferase family protein [Phycisphaerales bacterium]